MQKPMTLLVDLNTLNNMVPVKGNKVWEIFCKQSDAEVEKYLKESGIEVTPESKDKRLKEYFKECAHPLFSYLHVYKCGSCAKYHKMLTPCLLLQYDQELSAEDNPRMKVVMRNVTLAFPVPTMDGNALYSVHSNIKELAMLSSTSKELSLVLVDPAMKEFAVASDVVAH